MDCPNYLYLRLHGVKKDLIHWGWIRIVKFRILPWNLVLDW